MTKIRIIDMTMTRLCRWGMLQIASGASSRSHPPSRPHYHSGSANRHRHHFFCWENLEKIISFVGGGFPEAGWLLVKSQGNWEFTRNCQSFIFELGSVRRESHASQPSELFSQLSVKKLCIHWCYSDNCLQMDYHHFHNPLNTYYEKSSQTIVSKRATTTTPEQLSPLPQPALPDA